MDDITQEVESVDNKFKSYQQKPLELQSIFGFNKNVSTLNLSIDSHSKIFAMASSHVLQIFRCDGNESKCFIGHELDIFSLATDSTGQFIVSADTQGVINVWSVKVLEEFPHPIRTIYESHDIEVLTKVAISFDAKVLVTACENREEVFSILKLWLWSEGQNYPNDVLEMPDKYQKVENIRFSSNPKEFSFFVVTCSNGIFFGCWDPKTKKFLHHSPVRAISIHFCYVDSIFVENSDRAISITKCGTAVMWSNSITSEAPSQPSTFKKEFLKCVKLCDNPLKVIKSIDDSIVIADASGHVRFYDKELKILFWFPSNDSIDSVMSIEFDLKAGEEMEPQKILGGSQTFCIRNFLIQTSSEILAVDFPRMKFSRIFFKSEDYVTAFDIFPLSKKQICCANYSGRLMIYDYEKNVQVTEYQLSLLRRRSLTSDVDIIEIPHVSALAISRNCLHLIAGLDNGTIIILDPVVLKEIRYFVVSQCEILSMKFSPDSLFVTIYDKNFNLIVLNHDKATEEEWLMVGGRTKHHDRPIVDYLYISKLSTLPPITNSNRHKFTPPRLISLGEDRQIVEYDLNESMKDRATKLNVAFTKRIFQTSIPTAITLIYNSKKHEDQILIADNGGKFKIFDKNTFEIISTFMAPVYDSHVKMFDANTFAGLTPYSKYFVFSTDKYLGLYAMPLDGNMFRSLGLMGHSNGIKSIKVDSSRHFLFTLGHRCQSVFMWNINFQPLFDHLNEAGEGIKPYLHLLPGGQFGKFFKEMQNIFFYLLIVRTGNVLNEQIVKEGLDSLEIADFMRALGFYPTDYEIECVNHEMQLNGKKKLDFEELVKLFINHCPAPVQFTEVEIALKNLLSLNRISTLDAAFSASDLSAILTNDGESVSEENARYYLKELLGGTSQIFLSDFLKNILKLTDGFNLNAIM